MQLHVFLLLSITVVSAEVPLKSGNFCFARSYGDNSIVCVCNKDHCDFVDQIYPIPKGFAISYTSSQSGRRLLREEILVNNYSNEKLKKTAKMSKDTVTIQLHPDMQFQKIEGFGGCLTDSASMNIMNSFGGELTDTLIRSYFAPEGIEYNMIRVVLSSCDASTHVYSYDDVKDDFDLKNFKLTDEDHTKIEVLISANQSSSRPLKLFGSSWGSPGWMKTTGQMKGNGALIDSPDRKYQNTWANYYVRFLQEYAKRNISFWGLTTQNEPSYSCNEGIAWQGLCFTAETQRDFIKFELGPSLVAAGFKDLKLLFLDDNRNSLEAWTKTIMDDPDARKYVGALAFHWYTDPIVPSTVLDLTHESYPDLMMLQTEASTGGVHLGSWDLANNYARDIIDNLNHWVSGWVEWNLAMNTEGGPSWVHNLVDSPILVNSTAKEFYKQPHFYAIGHFSKFIQPGSIRIGFEISGSGADTVETVAVLSPTKNETIVVILNTGNNRTDVTVYQNKRDSISVSLEGYSIQTIIWPILSSNDNEFDSF